MQLADVNNRTMRVFVAEMASEKKAANPRFSPKSITSYVATVKSVVKSALDDRGEPVYNVNWNHEYIDLPVVEDQNTPSFTADEINAILAHAKAQERILYALLAGSGLRIGEAFALRVEDFYDNVIRVKASTWEGKLSSPKTVSGARKVDLHSTLAETLREHIGSRTEGFLFPSDTLAVSRSRIRRLGVSRFRSRRASYRRTHLPSPGSNSFHLAALPSLPFTAQ